MKMIYGSCTLLRYFSVKFFAIFIQNRYPKIFPKIFQFLNYLYKSFYLILNFLYILMIWNTKIYYVTSFRDPSRTFKIYINISIYLQSYSKEHDISQRFPFKKLINVRLSKLPKKKNYFIDLISSSNFHYYFQLWSRWYVVSYTCDYCWCLCCASENYFAYLHAGSVASDWGLCSCSSWKYTPGVHSFPYGSCGWIGLNI